MKRGPRKSWTFEGVSADWRLVGCDWRVLHRLGRHADEHGVCRISHTQLAAALGLHKRTVIVALQRLTKLGYVEITAIRRVDGGYGANRYRLLEVDLQAEISFPEEAAPQVASAPPPQVVSTPPPLVTPGIHHPGESTDSPHRTTSSERLEETTTWRRRAKRAAAGPPPPDRPEFLLPMAGGQQAGTGGQQAGTEARGEPVDGKRIASPVPPDMAERLVRAAGPAFSPTAMIGAAHLSMSDPMRWLRDGADFDLDVLPTVERLSARKPPGSVKSWGYFGEAVTEARTRRIAAATAVEIISPPARRQTGPPGRGDRWGRRNGWAALYRKLTEEP